MGNENLERLLDLIADALIQSDIPELSKTVFQSQKFIRDGLIKTGRLSNNDTLVLYQKDVEANKEDLNNLITLNEGTDSEEIIPELQSIADLIGGYSHSGMDGFDLVTCQVELGEDEDGQSVSIYLEGEMFTDNQYPITELIMGDGNPLNVGQFIPMQQSSSIIDVEQANEFLDTNIYELLPTGDARQDRINRFFQELSALLPPNEPNFETPIQRDNFTDWIGSEQYSKNNSISYAQENDDSNIDEDEAYVHRLTSDSINNPDSLSIPNSENESKTIEDIYNIIEPYLRDILEPPAPAQDDRPQYRNESNGYLKFRNPNQGIIIRNTNQEFVEGLDPSNPTYLDTGFTITMWVRFLDKVSEGTLFNFGNPTRGYGSDSTAMGFKLETYVLDKEDGNFTTSNNYDNYGEAAEYIIGNDDNYIPPFENTNTARFVRLVVNDNGVLRDSHIATGAGTKMTTIWDESVNGDTESKRFRRLQTTLIPEDFNEWYFICASFNPIILEDESFDLTNPPGFDLQYMSNFWLNHINPSDGSFVANSIYGNRCKVEIISRTDLLRARGFKV